MRRYLLALILLAAVLAAGAQQKGTLSLSKSAVTVKITNPAKQLTTFAPVLDLIEGVADGADGPAGKMVDFHALRERLAKLAAIPGANATGDYWIVVMPAPEQKKPAAAGEEVTPANVQVPKTVMYALIPVTDKAAFAKFITDEKLIATYAGNYAIVTDDKSNPQYTDVKFDITLHTKRDIAIAFMGDTNLDIAPNLPGDQAMAFERIADTLKSYQRNVQQGEVGLAMAGDDFSAEYFLVPRKGSALEHGLLTAGGGQLALEYAGYLPADLAYASVSDPMIDGAPGAARMSLEFITSLLGMLLPPDTTGAFGKSLETLMAQCSQGRAIGITSTPANTPVGPTLVGVYHVTSAPIAKNAVRDFVKQVQTVRQTFMGGTLTQLFTLDLKPAGETVGDTPIDVINFKLNMGKPAGAPGTTTAPAPPLFKFEGRVAYLDDKMLVTFGADSQQQMSTLVDRVKGKKTAFTDSPRFQALKACLPAKVHGFEAYATLDLARMGVKTVLQGPERANALKWLSIFPTQRTVISSYQDVQGGNVHGMYTIPAEQMNFIFTLVKAMMEMKQNAAAPAGK